METIFDYVKQDTRFNNIIKNYLNGVTISDLEFLTQGDLINLIPKDKPQDILMMTILVRRYLKLK